LSYARVNHAQTALANGEVLIVGGGGDSYPAAAELYNPATRAFSLTGSLSSPRQEHTATLDEDLLLIIGGVGPGLDPLASAEGYDPATGLFTNLPPLEEARSAHTALVTPLRSLLVAGGNSGGSATSGTGELY